MGAVLLSSVIVLTVCIKKKRGRNKEHTQESGSPDNLEIQENQAYVLNSHSAGQNAAYGVSNTEINGGCNTWQSGEYDTIKDVGSYPLYESL